MSGACPTTASAFRHAVNMGPDAIRSWARDPRSKCASFASTRARLPGLADLKAKPTSSWTQSDCRRAARVVSFVARMSGVVRQHGCTPKAVVSLLNWGHRPRCPKPPAGCRASGK